MRKQHDADLPLLGLKHFLARSRKVLYKDALRIELGQIIRDLSA